MAVKSVRSENVPKLDFKEIISINVLFLQVFGVIRSEAKSTAKILAYLHRATAYLVLASLLTSEVTNMLKMMVSGDIEKMSEGSFLTLTTCLYAYKVHYVYKHELKLTSLIKSLNRAEFEPKIVNQYQALRGYTHQSKVISKIFLSACVATCGFWAVLPFTEDIYLPIPGWFPFNTNYSPIYEMVYVYQIVAVTYVGLSNVSFDLLMSGLIMVVCGQLNILNDSIKNIRQYAEIELFGGSVVSHGISPELQKKMDENLVKCVIHHLCILEFADDLTFLFTKIILWQFLASVIIICTTLFEITMLPIMSIKFFSLILYQFCMLLEIFLLCYYGNEVIWESNELTKSAYCSDWIESSPEFKRKLRFFMTRSQRRLTLYAGGFFTLSLETFVKILKSSWSYFAFLYTVHSKENADN